MDTVFTMTPAGPEGGDCTVPYHVNVKENTTLREFINTVLLRKEWGLIVIRSENDRFKEYEITYEQENMAAPTEEHMDSIVRHVTAQGGWTNMNYVLTIE